jgi:hypothetical protein
MLPMASDGAGNDPNPRHGLAETCVCTLQLRWSVSRHSPNVAGNMIYYERIDAVGATINGLRHVRSVEGGLHAPAPARMILRSGLFEPPYPQPHRLVNLRCFPAPSSPPLIFCHPNTEAACLVFLGEQNPSVLKGCAEPDQCRNVAGDWVLAFFDALNRGRADSGGFR